MTLKVILLSSTLSSPIPSHSSYSLLESRYRGSQASTLLYAGAANSGMRRQAGIQSNKFPTWNEAQLHPSIVTLPLGCMTPAGILESSQLPILTAPHKSIITHECNASSHQIHGSLINKLAHIVWAQGFLATQQSCGAVTPWYPSRN